MGNARDRYNDVGSIVTSTVIGHISCQDSVGVVHMPPAIGTLSLKFIPWLNDLCDECITHSRVSMVRRRLCFRGEHACFFLTRPAVTAFSPSGGAWAEQRSRGLPHPFSSSSSCFVLAVGCSWLAGHSSNGNR